MENRSGNDSPYLGSVAHDFVILGLFRLPEPNKIGILNVLWAHR